MPDFKNLKELEKYMKKVLLDSMNDVGEKVGDELKKQIDKDVYSVYNPEKYERTEQLRDSVTSETYTQFNDMVISEIGHDYDKIIPNSNKYQHTSIWGDDVSEYLPEWINNGEIGLAFGEGAWTEPRPYMDNMKDRIKDERLLEKELKNALKKRGISTD